MTKQETILAEQSCSTAHGEGKLLSDKQITELLSQTDGWECDGTTLVKTFETRDFHETVAFVNAVACIAHWEDHHPEMLVRYAQCRVTYTTHDAGGLTHNDFICASKVDRLARK